MDIWKVLETEPTKDKNLLKNIYRTKLSKVNPEDDPDGFMELRNAYEEAVKLADRTDEAEDKTNDDSVVVSALKKLYNCFKDRISEDAWNQIFDMDEFVSLDTAEDSFNELMVFLMSNFHLPQKIWKLIETQFEIAERKKELSERFPEDFIEYILNNAEFEDILNYYLLEGDESEYDDYIEKFYELDNAIRRLDLERQTGLIELLESMDVYHPYLEVCRAKNKIQNIAQMNKDTEKSESAAGEKYDGELCALQDKLDELQKKYPYEIYIINSCGDIAMFREKYDTAQKYYDMSYELAPDNYVVKGKRAELKYELGDYEQARDIYMELLKINHYDNNVRAGMMRANQALVEEFKRKLEENPDDNKLRMEMAWSYYQSYKFDEAIRVLDEFEPEKESICEYNNVKGRSYLCLNEYDKALECFLKWKQEIEGIPDDASKDDLDKKKRYEYVNFLIADCYIKTKRYEQARSHLNTALAREHDEIILSYEARCELEYVTGNYAECIRACENLIAREPRNYIGYDYMAKASVELEYYKDAINACEHAIRIYPYVSEPYALEARIYLDVRHVEGAKNIIGRYRAFGIDSDLIDYWEARVLEYEGKNKEVVELLDGTLNRYDPDDTDMNDSSEIYLILGFNLEKTGDTERAMKLYKRTVEVNPEHKSAYGRMGILYKNMGEYDEAIKMLSRQLEINPHPFYYTHRALINQYLQNYKTALADYEIVIEAEPDNSFCLTRIGVIYERHREFDKALEYYDRALEYMDAEEDKSDRARVCSFQARTLQCMNLFDKSRKKYEEYFEEFGLDADVAYVYAALLQRMNCVDDAVDILKKCIDTLDYDDSVQSCIRQLCSVYGEEGYIDMANETFRLAISRRKDDPMTYAAMAKVFLSHGLYEDAQKLYEEAVKYDTDNVHNYYSGLIEAILSRKTIFKPDIREYLKRAVIDVSDMNSPMDYIKMATLKRVTKKYKEALEIIDRGIKIKRCSGCFYGSCHEAIYEKGLIYEALKDYDMAKMCYVEAIGISGHNAVYEERLKKLEKKDKR